MPAPVFTSRPLRIFVESPSHPGETLLAIEVIPDQREPRVRSLRSEPATLRDLLLGLALASAEVEAALLTQGRARPASAPVNPEPLEDSAR